MSVYFSNRQEVLFEHLKENLFSAGDSLFSKRFLIVPTKSIATWVRLKLAEDLTIATGIETLFLDQALSRFSKTKFPSEIELTLQIEEELEKCERIESYLKGREKRFFPLASHLATLFRRYCLYGKKIRHENEWQEEIFERVFPEGNPCEKILKERFHVEQDISFHLFLFNHLSPFHFSFFEKLAKSAPLFFYHLSPCHEFWSEMMSDKELSKKGISEEFLEEHHPLLANLGQLGRRFAAQVEESSFETIEDYIPPPGKSHLADLQRGMLQLEKPQKNCDDSIQVHIHRTKGREIEGLYHTLGCLMQEKKINPSEVTVFAPDITSYEPYIKAIFGKTISYQIDDLNADNHTPLSVAFLHLLDLERRRWSSKALFELFSCPLFRKKQNWGSQELGLIENWIAKSGIRWGFDLEHARQFLDGKDLFNDGRATWKEGIRRLVLSLATEDVPFTAAVLLGSWEALVQKLFEDLRPLYDGRGKTFKEWHTILDHLLENYFVQEEGLEALFHLLESGMRFKPKRLYTFDRLWPLLIEALKKESVTICAHQLESVKFCSILPMRAVCSKVIVLLGMDHESFPRKERNSGLDLLKAEKNYYVQGLADFDRYFFLEALLSAREFLLISYVGISPNDGTPIPPTTALSYVLPYLDEKNSVCHPDFAFDSSYFDGSNPLLKNSSLEDFQRCQAQYKQEASKPFLSTLKPALSKLLDGDHVIDIKHFAYSFQRPLKRYFEKKLGISLQESLSAIKEEEEFVLSPLEVSKFRRLSLRTPLHTLLTQLENEKNAPLAQFNLLAKEKVATTVGQLHKTLELFSIKKEECFTVQFSLQAREAKQEKGVWVLPPLHLEYGSVHIDFVGTIEGVTPAGLFVHEKCNLEGAVRQFPLFLLLQLADLPQDWERSTLFFGKEGESRSRFFENPKEYLEHFLRYYFFLQENPSLLIPSWVESLLEKDDHNLQKKMGEKSFDQEISFATLNLSSGTVIENWHEMASNLYGELKNAWF